MIGILIVAHGTLGETLIQCATHMLGQRPGRISSVIVAGRGDPETLYAQIDRLSKELDDGSGVLILTDMLGATPSNVAVRAIVAGKVEVVTGVNLPMLIRALTYRSQPLEKMVQKAISGGQDGVTRLTSA
jgi:mannose PTS system EIIA component